MSRWFASDQFEEESYIVVKAPVGLAMAHFHIPGLVLSSAGFWVSFLAPVTQGCFLQTLIRILECFLS